MTDDQRESLIREIYSAKMSADEIAEETRCRENIRSLGIVFMYIGLVIMALTRCGGSVQPEYECQVELQIDGSPYVALDAIDSWNADHDCKAVVSANGIVVHSDAQEHEVYGLIADLVCEVAPC